MKTKKLISFLLVLATVLCLAGCSKGTDGNDDGSDPKGTSNSIYGKWEVTLDATFIAQYSDETKLASLTLDEQEMIAGLIFMIALSPNQTLTIEYEFAETYVKEIMNGEVKTQDNPKYTQDGNKWIVEKDGEPETFIVKGNKLVLEDVSVIEFTRK